MVNFKGSTPRVELIHTQKIPKISRYCPLKISDIESHTLFYCPPIPLYSKLCSIVRPVSVHCRPEHYRPKRAANPALPSAKH